MNLEEGREIAGAERFDAAGRPRSELGAIGKARQKTVPRRTHATWALGRRADPVQILRGQDERRLADLVPGRYGHMVESPFAFYRGSAAVVAADLGSLSTTGISVQARGDAHLANFGVYATPERRLVFDVNDFDETLPASWEYDLKRLAASVWLMLTRLPDAGA